LPNSGTSGPILSGGDILEELKPIYSYVDQQLEQAANEVLRVVPVHRLPSCEKQGTDLTSSSNDGVCIITLPDDFLRLVRVKLAEWSNPVIVPISVDHPLYRHQFNKYTRGHQDKPVAVYIDTADKKELECYSYSNNGDVEYLSYIQKFEKGSDYDTTIAELIALTCARKVFEVYGNTEQVSMMTSEIQNVLNTMLL
jgi:hypothetical protein